MTICTSALQASLSITSSWSLLKLMSIASVMPSNHLILCCPLFLPPSTFPRIRSFPVSRFVTSCGQSIEVSALAPVLPMNIQGVFPLRWTGLISLLSKELSSIFSSTTVQKHQFFGAQPSLWSNFTSIHDYWKTHSFDSMDLCWQSDDTVLHRPPGLARVQGLGVGAKIP